MAQSIESLPSELLELFNKLPEEAVTAKSDPQHALQLHKLLSDLDPIMAGRWHWRDTRKVLRSLHIIRENRRRASDVVSEQSANDVASRPRSAHEYLTGYNVHRKAYQVPYFEFLALLRAFCARDSYQQSCGQDDSGTFIIVFSLLC